ncbi:hypothetical protein ABFS82_08G149600 [Erythranthe guttata]|uniref:Pentacotripeptide-repeat region of PRORP domain-containing protein n=1 Tax=Erythranthe guttata TaxID=4155 RepID=A0A022R2R9_ERYGU|nr:PREDICTED: pentatricopeptide repeat-containing protein At1g61870, mitochondrial-like [Erythranthe guttata]EYU33903.1 hypothetical protein MIMGU_mgv1a018525mg [Erythranthe guttata]|eukprot:XP_012841995.1 PREDICTED: pentatricopeptide repeat-containing protein At1g61870, mitochondrial-like [Erythranthe guttata]
MAFRSKLRLLTLQRNRPFSSSILNPDSKTPPLSRKEKSRAALSALSLLRLETNPERIVDICRATSLTHGTHLYRDAYSVAISKLKKSNNYGGIRTIIKNSLSRTDCRSELSVSHLIVLYGQAGLIKDALQLFDEMPSLGIQIGVKALNSLLFSCIIAGEYSEMKRVFSDFPGKYGLEPNVDTYNTVLKGLCESGSADSAHSILAEMESKGINPDAKTFSVAIAGFYKEEKFDDVEKMIVSMKKYGVEKGIGIYNVMMQSLCKLKRSNEAKALLDEILLKNMTPNSVTYGHLIHGFCKEGKLDVAKSLFEEMISRELKPQAECYFTMVYYLCKGNDFEVALTICKESMSKGWIPNMTTMRCLVSGLISVEKVDEAKEIIAVMKDKFSRNVDPWIEIEEGLPK